MSSGRGHGFSVDRRPGKAEHLRFLSKTDAVAERLRSEIMSGTLSPGAQIRQDEIALRLGVSSTPVREAFRILQAEGFLERRTHHGVVVASVDDTAMEDIYEIRGTIERLALRRAVANLDGAIVAEMESALAKGSKLLAKPDMHGFRLAAAEFHRLLVVAAGSAILVEVSAGLRARSNFFTPLDKAGMLEVQRHHQRILAALRRRDLQRATSEVIGHTEWNVHRLRQAKGRRVTREASLATR